MTWEERDSLDEVWLPSWSGDEEFRPDKAPPEEKPDPAPPDDTKDLDCRVNLALWWFALLADGPPPDGEWVEFADEWDADAQAAGGEVLRLQDIRNPNFLEEVDEFMRDAFRENNGGELEC